MRVALGQCSLDCLEPARTVLRRIQQRIDFVEKGGYVVLHGLQTIIGGTSADDYGPIGPSSLSGRPILV
jgi:hypothetical protein